MNYSELLQEKGFSLNEYPDGKYYALVINVEDQYDEGQRVLKIFGLENEDPDTVILQCREDFTTCSLYDGFVYEFETEEFMNLVSQL